MDNAAAILHQNSGATAYNTPADIVEVGRCLVGGAFDLDPASNEFANSYIRAKTIYTEDMNGINLPWGGRIWVNQKGICTCPCHSESVKLAGTHINLVA